jgi:DNA-binding NarL/FixJ family response regulator
MPANSQEKRILLVEDHPIVRLGFAQLIQQEATLRVCAEAEDSRQAIEAVEREQPDLVIIDLGLKQSSGLDLIKVLQGLHPNLPLLVVSLHDETLYAQRVLKAGARGYVMKREAPDCLLVAIKRVLNGEIYVSEQMSSRLLNWFVRGARPEGSPLERLSDRELEVFRFLGQGSSTREIAEALNLSVKTVETHRAHIMDKLSLGGATELLRYAVHSLEELGES